MKIYTKTGDKGTTALIGGKRVSKTHMRIEAYGTTDELISYLAALRDKDIQHNHKEFILQIQNELMVISSHLAADCDDCIERLPKLSEESIVKLEKEIDRLELGLEPLMAFIVPGGHETVSVCHIARTICRRTERIVLTLAENVEVPEIILKYFNRLSDYLFILARALAKELKVEEIIWKPVLYK